MDGNRNEDKKGKGKGIRKKDGNWDWKEGREKRLRKKRRMGKELERSTGMERDWEDEQY